MDKEMIKAELREAARLGLANPMEIAKLVNTPYDPEKPVADVISAIYTTDTIDRDEVYDYFVADQDTKTVTTVTSGSVTQTNVTPLTDVELTFSTRSSEEFNVYLDDLMVARHDMLAKKNIALMEALNRIDQYDAVQCIDGAVETARKFTLQSGQTRFLYTDLTKLANSIEEYTNYESLDNGEVRGNLVLITGKNVTLDIRNWVFDDDKNHRLALSMAGVSRWIPISGQQVTLGSAKDIIDPDVAYLCAPDFTVGRETAHFVRKRVTDLAGGGADKERIVIARGPIIPEGATPKLAFTVGAAQATGCVVVNAKPFAKFTRS